MNFDFSDEQRMLVDMADRLGGELWPATERLKLLADGDALIHRTWAQMAELGWLMLPISEANGGLGGSAVDVMAITGGIGRHLVPVPFVATSVLVPALIGDHGNDATAELLAGIGEGRLRAAAGFLEPDSGYDLAHVGVTAEQSGDGWVLRGEKLHVEDGGTANWFVVTARTAGATHEADGISLFMLPADASGLGVQRFRAIDEHRHARLTLDGVRGAILIGEADAALPLVEQAVDRAICAHAAEAVGSMEAAHGATLDYLRTRKQFGKEIGSFQSLQHRAVDMAVALEEARSICLRATLSLDLSPRERRRAVSAAKTRVGQCGLYVGRQAVQLHGGVGFSSEAIISHHLKRQMMLDQAHGPADHHLRLFAQAA